MAQHTPAPWLLEETSPRRFVYASNPDGENQFSVLLQGGWRWRNHSHGERTPDTELEANARLIASAPDLFEALSRLHAVLDFEETIQRDVPFSFDNPAEINAAFDSALAALAKATAEQSA